MRAWKKLIYGGHGLRPVDSKLVSAEAQVLVDRMIRVLGQFLRHEGIELTPWVVLRADEAVTAYAIAVELEQVLHAEGVYLLEPQESTQASETPTTASDPPAGDHEERTTASIRSRRLHPAVELAAKARDRFRKALQELQAACQGGTGRAGTSWAEAIEATLNTLPPVESGAFVEFLATDDPKREAQLLNQLTAGVGK